ncbi:MAG: AMP-binding protein [Thiobacillus sp.]
MNPPDSPDDAAHSRLDVLIDELGLRGKQTAIQAWTATAPDCWSYRKLGEQVLALARGLHQRIEPGESVALIGADRPQWIMAALAMLRAGAVVTPLDAQLAGDTLKHVLEDSGARWVFTTAALRDRVRQASAGAQIVLLDADDEDADSWHALADSDAPLPDNRAGEPAVLFYTSGTTGPPKGAPLSHRNIEVQLDILAEAGITQDGDRVLLPLPLHHVYPFVIGMLGPIRLGLTLVIPHALTGKQIARAIREGEASVIIGVPRLYAALLEGIAAQARHAGRISGAMFRAMLGLSRIARRCFGLHLGKRLLRPLHRSMGMQLRVLACGGAALDPELAWNLEALGWQVAVGYGLTETAPLLTIDPPGRPRPGTVGLPVPGVELRIDRSAARGEGGHPDEGEILVRGPNVFAGYRNRPEATREAFAGDGWFRTGDLGWLDDDGYLHVSGRVSTLIVTPSGENIQPDDLEGRYADHKAIREIGILQHEGRLAALIVPAGGVDEDAEQRVRNAIGEIAGKLPSYQRLDEVALTRSPLPRTRLGKIRRHELEQRFMQARSEGGETRPATPIALEDMSVEDRTLVEQPLAGQAWAWLAKRYPKQGLSPDSHMQMELGVDSMAWLGLSLELGQLTGVELDDAAIGRIDTVRDLLRELVDAAGGSEEIADPVDEPERVLDPVHLRWLRPRGPMILAVARAMYAVNRATMRGLFRLQVQDGQHVPVSGPVVLVCNHASYLDPFAVAAALSPARLHTLYWGGLAGVAFTNPLTRFGSRAAQVIPIDPQHGARSSLALAAAVLARERGLIWFPEGGRSESGELQPFRPGIGRLLERYPVPVVPVAIHGSYDALPPGRHIPRLRRLTLRFGEAIDPRHLAEAGQGDSAQARIVNALEARMKRLLALHAPDDGS